LKDLQAAQGEDAEGLALIAHNLADAGQSFERASRFVLEHARAHLPAVFFGSVPYLQLAGTVLAGWQLARAALASVKQIQAGSTDVFYRRKIATAVFYAAHILPRAHALTKAVEQGVLTQRYASVLTA